MTILKSVVKWVCYSVVLIFLLLLITPTILSTEAAKNYCLGHVNNQIAGKLSLKEMQIGWTTGIQMRGLEVEDPDGRTVISCKEASLNDSIFSLITSPLSFGHLRIDTPFAHLYETENGSMTLTQAFQAKNEEPNQKQNRSRKSELSSPFIPYLSEAEISNGALMITGAKKEQMTINNFEMKLSLKGFQEAQLTLNATVEQNGKVAQCALQATASNLKELKSLYQEKLQQKPLKKARKDPAEVHLTAQLTQFPVEIADNLLALSDPKLKGLLKSAIGSNLDVNIRHRLTKDDCQLSFQIQSDEITSKAIIEATTDGIQLPQPASFSWRIQPHFFEKLQQLIPTLKSFQLQQLSTFQAELKTAKNNEPYSITFGLESPLKLRCEGKPELQLALSGTSALDRLLQGCITKANIQLSSGTETAKITAAIDLKNQEKNQSVIQAAIKTEGTLSPFVDGFQAIEPYLGKELHTDITIVSEKKKNSLMCEVSAPFATQDVVDLIGKKATINAHQDQSQITFKLVSDKLHLNFAENNKLHLAWNPALEGINHLLDTINAGFRTTKELHINLDVSLHSKKPLHEFQSKDFNQLSGHLVIPDVELRHHHMKQPLKIHDLSLPFDFDNNNKELQTKIEFAVADETHNGTLKAKLQLHDFSTENITKKVPQIYFQGNFTNIPVAPIAEFAYKKDIGRFLKDQLSGHWELNYQGLESPQNCLSFSLNAKELEIASQLCLQDNFVCPLNNKIPLSVKATLS
ncbi:MAG TPA: hypothetical protein VN457_08030, partial [Chlamydiales bacterium]|nr:hypothetical protein [Chlamydiales bacterium]